VHLVGLITKKFVTMQHGHMMHVHKMHGHMNVKKLLVPGAINTYITFANNLRGFHYVTSRKPNVRAEQVQAFSPVQPFPQLLDLKPSHVSH
jgi:hypothetical protein